MKRKIEIEFRESEGPLDTPWGVRMRKIEARVTKSDEAGIKARWDSGRELLKKRGDKKQLPKGVLGQTADGLGVERSELVRRMKFAAKFSSEEQLRHTVTKFVSWHQIVKEALPDKKRTAKAKRQRTKTTTDNVVRVRFEWKQWRIRLAEIKSRANELTETDLKELDNLYDAITEIFTAREAAQKKQAR